jgi:D-3-phosphoglycerate dehydrogenase
VKGAVLHGTAPRLLSIDDIDVEAPLERNLLYLRNRDVPGVIGKVGTILGEHKINIANFSLGRASGNGGSSNKTEPRRAVAVVHIDGRVPEEVLKALRKIPAIEQARAIRLF